MIAQRKDVSIGTVSVNTDFDVNHNPHASKAYIYIQGSVAPTTKTIQARLHPDGPWVAATNDGTAVSPTAGSDTYTEVDMASQYRIILAAASSGTATIVVAN